MTEREIQKKLRTTRGVAVGSKSNTIRVRTSSPPFLYVAIDDEAIALTAGDVRELINVLTIAVEAM